MIVATAVAVAGIATIVVLVTRGEAPPVDLAAVVTRDDPARFVFSGTDDAEASEDLPNGSHVRLSASITIRPEAGAEDGATRIVTVDDVHMRFENDELPVGIGAPQRLHLLPDGRPRELVMVAAAPDGTVFYYLDLLYPVVPSAETSEGDTWPISFETSPPAADGTASYTGTGELIGFDDLQGVRTAVVRNELTFRYDFVVSAPEVADLSGLGSIRAGSVRVDGTGTLTLTAWIDPRTGRMLRATTHGSYDIGYVYEDFEPAFPGGTFSVQGSFGYELTAD